jgi:hypothetical protein
MYDLRRVWEHFEMVGTDRAACGRASNLARDPPLDLRMKAQEIKCPGQHERCRFVSRSNECQQVITNVSCIHQFIVSGSVVFISSDSKSSRLPGLRFASITSSPRPSTNDTGKVMSTDNRRASALRARACIRGNSTRRTVEQLLQALLMIRDLSLMKCDLHFAAQTAA